MDGSLGLALITSPNPHSTVNGIEEPLLFGGLLSALYVQTSYFFDDLSHIVCSNDHKISWRQLLASMSLLFSSAERGRQNPDEDYRKHRLKLVHQVYSH